MTLMEQTEKAELLLSPPSPRRQSKKAELLPGTIQAVFLSKTTKESNCHCSSRVLEQKLEKKKSSLSKPCPCQENKEAKKSRKYHYSSLQDDRARKFPWLSAWPLHLTLVSPKKSLGKAERRRRPIPQILTLKQRQLIQQCQVDQCWLSFPLSAYARYGGYCK